MSKQFHFVENEKVFNHLVQRLFNIMDGQKQTNLNPIFFLCDSCWKSTCIILKKHNITPIDKSWVFS